MSLSHTFSLPSASSESHQLSQHLTLIIKPIPNASTFRFYLRNRHKYQAAGFKVELRFLDGERCKIRNQYEKRRDLGMRSICIPPRQQLLFADVWLESYGPSTVAANFTMLIHNLRFSTNCHEHLLLTKSQLTFESYMFENALSVNISNDTMQRHHCELAIHSLRNAQFDCAHVNGLHVELPGRRCAFLGWVFPKSGMTEWHFDWEELMRAKNDGSPTKQHPQQLTAQTFVDHEFPAQPSSIVSLNADRELLRFNLRHMTWIPLRQLYGHLSLFPTDSTLCPSSIIQGKHLGNCWHLAALTAIVNRDESLIRALATHDIFSRGHYQFRFFKNAHWSNVSVDQLVPCLDGVPLFASCGDGHAWLALLEKAYAKLHGSYFKLYGGWPFVALHEFTGHPVRCFFMSSIRSCDQLCNLLKEYCHAGYILVICSNKEKDTLRSIGLRTAHAYAVLGVRDSGSEMLTQLRDPQGNHKFRSELDRPADACTFWIGSSMLHKHFATLQVCFYNPHRKVQAQTLPILWDPSGMLSIAYEFVPKEDTEVYVGLIQEDIAILGTAPFNVIGMRLFEFVTDQDNYDVVAEIKATMSYIQYTQSVMLKRSCHYRLVAICGKDGIHTGNKARFCLHSSHDLEICSEPHTKRFTFSRQLQSHQWLIAQALQEGIIISQKEDHGITVYEWTHQESIIFVVSYRGSSNGAHQSNSLLYFQPHCEVQNVRILVPEENAVRCLKIAPGGTELCFRGLVNPEEAFGYSFSYKYKVVRV